MNIIDTTFVSALKSEIAKQLSNGDEPVTRSTVLAAMNLGLNADGLKDAELAVSLAFRLGLVPEYKMFQKIGIKPADYVTGSQKKAEKPAKPKRKVRGRYPAPVVVTVAPHSAPKAALPAPASSAPSDDETASEADSDAVAAE